MSSYEQQLIAEKRIARWQLQEIRRMFDMADADNSGELSPADIGLMLQRVCKGKELFFITLGSVIGYQDLQGVFQKIGTASSNSISWDEFLRGISYAINDYDSYASMVSQHKSHSGDAGKYRCHWTSLRIQDSI